MPAATSRGPGLETEHPMQYFVVMIDYGRRGREAIVDPEITRREVISRVVSGEYNNISFIHEIADAAVDDITAEISASMKRREGDETGRMPNPNRRNGRLKGGSAAGAAPRNGPHFLIELPVVGDELGLVELAPGVTNRGTRAAWRSALCICEGAAQRLRRCKSCRSTIHCRSFRTTTIRKEKAGFRPLQRDRPPSSMASAKGFNPPAVGFHPAHRKATLCERVHQPAVPSSPSIDRVVSSSSALWCHISASASNRQLSRGR